MIARHFPSEDYRKTLLCVLYIIMPFVVFVASFAYAYPAQAHAGPDYCGHSERWITVDGKLHRQAFVSELSGPDHRYKGAHYIFNGTGYVRVSDWDYARADNCH